MGPVWSLQSLGEMRRGRTMLIRYPKYQSMSRRAQVKLYAHICA